MSNLISLPLNKRRCKVVISRLKDSTLRDWTPNSVLGTIDDERAYACNLQTVSNQTEWNPFEIAILIASSKAMVSASRDEADKCK